MLAKVARVHCSLLVGHFRYGLMGPYEGGLAADPMDQLIVLLREVKKSLIPITLSDLHQWKLVNLQHHIRKTGYVLVSPYYYLKALLEEISRIFLIGGSSSESNDSRACKSSAALITIDSIPY